MSCCTEHKTSAAGEQIAQPFGFTGHQYDAEPGMVYMRARYYAPDMGRFITEDPLGFGAGDVNFYAYVGNNPVNFTDPLGLYEITIADPGGRNGETYGGTMRIVGDSGQVAVVNVSSWPNPNNPAPGIAPGVFNSVYSETGHRQTTNGVRLENGAPIPTVGPNPNQNGNSIADGINIHCGAALTRRGSANCITIQPDQCQQVWDALQGSPTGTVDLSRSILKYYWLNLLNLFNGGNNE